MNTEIQLLIVAKSLAIVLSELNESGEDFFTPKLKRFINHMIDGLPLVIADRPDLQVFLEKHEANSIHEFLDKVKTTFEQLDA